MVTTYSPTGRSEIWYRPAVFEVPILRSLEALSTTVMCACGTLLPAESVMVPVSALRSSCATAVAP